MEFQNRNYVIFRVRLIVEIDITEIDNIAMDMLNRMDGMYIVHIIHYTQTLLLRER